MQRWVTGLGLVVTGTIHNPFGVLVPVRIGVAFMVISTSLLWRRCI